MAKYGLPDSSIPDLIRIAMHQFHAKPAASHIKRSTYFPKNVVREARSVKQLPEAVLSHPSFLCSFSFPTHFLLLWQRDHFFSSCPEDPDAPAKDPLEDVDHDWSPHSACSFIRLCSLLSCSKTVLSCFPLRPDGALSGSSRHSHNLLLTYLSAVMQEESSGRNERTAIVQFHSSSLSFLLAQFFKVSICRDLLP